MYPARDTPPHAFLLPVELYHQIIFLLDVRDLFAFRRSCKYFLTLTEEPSICIWAMIFTHLRAIQPLPCSRAEFTAMSSSQAERLLLITSKVEASFLQLRERLTYNIPDVKQSYLSSNASSCCLRVLTFISDRFLLSVDTNAVVIWDTVALASSSPVVASSPWAHFTLSNFLCYVECDSSLYVAIARSYQDYQSAIIYSVRLPSFEENEHHEGQLHQEAEFPMPDNGMLKHMDPCAGRALLYSSPDSIHIVHWHDGNRQSTISLQRDEMDQGWNGVASLRFCGPYILCFRVRAVEAYPIPTDTSAIEPLPLLRHRFGALCFRAVSISRVRVSHCPESGDIYTIYVLANDTYQGMIHFRIRITTSPVPTMSVDILAKGSIRPSEPPPLIPGTETRYTLEDIIRRSFISTWSLGSAGLRGVWVDRQRGSIERRVVAFTTHPRRLRNKEADLVAVEGGPASDKPPTMEGKAVHVIPSYDLRDDITICAVSEWTGRIALGSRVGAISLL